MQAFFLEFLQAVIQTTRLWLVQARFRVHNGSMCPASNSDSSASSLPNPTDGQQPDEQTGSPKEIDPFIVDAERTLRRLQGALGEILDALPGRPARPQHIVELLKIDQKLAWRVANTIQSSDPFAAAQYVPGLAAFKKFLAVAAKAGATETLTNNAKDAFTDYERLTRTHAGDRASLEMMLTACAQEDQTTADLNHRRMAFRGLSYVWGAQAKTQLKTAIIAPSTDPGLSEIGRAHV